MAPRRSRKPMATIQKKESRQAGPGGRAMAGAEAADCEVSVLTAIVGKVFLFSHDLRGHPPDKSVMVRAGSFWALDALRRWPEGSRGAWSRAASTLANVLLWIFRAGASLGLAGLCILLRQ